MVQVASMGQANKNLALVFLKIARCSSKSQALFTEMAFDRL